MSANRKLAKCPQCLPDARGAIFKAEYNEGAMVWRCCNCHYETPRRTNKPQQKITPSQQEVIDRLTAMGWRVEVKFLSETSRVLWLTAECDNNFIIGNRTFGTVGPRGSFMLHTTGFGPDKLVTDWSGVAIWLPVVKKV